MRIALFLLTNLAVMVVFGLVLSLTGIQSSSMTGLLIMALLFGFGGSIVSLLMSKWMALKSVGGDGMIFLSINVTNIKGRSCATCLPGSRPLSL